MDGDYASFLCVFPVIISWLLLILGVSRSLPWLLHWSKHTSDAAPERSLTAITASKSTVVSDSFLRYWRILEAIIPIKVDLVDAGLASGLPCAADRHGRGQASCLGHRDDPQRAPPPTSQPSRHPTARGAPTTTRRPYLSRLQTLYYADADT